MVDGGSKAAGQRIDDPVAGTGTRRGPRAAATTAGSDLVPSFRPLKAASGSSARSSSARSIQGMARWSCRRRLTIGSRATVARPAGVCAGASVDAAAAAAAVAAVTCSAGGTGSAATRRTLGGAKVPRRMSGTRRALGTGSGRGFQPPALAPASGTCCRSMQGTWAGAVVVVVLDPPGMDEAWVQLRPSRDFDGAVPCEDDGALPLAARGSFGPQASGGRSIRERGRRTKGELVDRRSCRHEGHMRGLRVPALVVAKVNLTV
jgi:hypothetical protein